MSRRQNFNDPQRQSAFEMNAQWLRDHRVTGVELALAFEPLRRRGLVYYCENCLFCHSDQSYFDIDHLVPDRNFRIWQKHLDAREAINMVVLCKSLKRGDYGCNQSKGSRLFVPRGKGLAFSRADLDMNCFPVRERPFDHVAS